MRYRIKENQIEALELTIKNRWALHAASDFGFDKNANTKCICCEHFSSDKEGSLNCGHCPISIYTGKHNCNGTPYWHWEKSNIGPAMKTFAEKELSFLRKVLKWAQTRPYYTV